MKKILITIALAAPVLGLHAQLYVGPGETVTVLEGTDVFFAGVQVDDSGTPGLLDVQSTAVNTNCVIDGVVLGDTRISFGDLTNLSLDNGTWTTEWDSPNENNEVLNDLTIGANGEVRVPPVNSLTTNGEFINGNALYLEADANGYGQLLTLGTVTTKGVTEAQQFFTVGTTEGWRQMSSPVTTSLDDIKDDFDFSYSPVAHAGGLQDSTQNIWWYDASPINPAGGNTTSTLPLGSDANAKHWTYATASEAIGPANNAKGWDIWMGAPNVYTDGGRMTLTGEFGNGNYDFDCYRTDDFIANQSGTTNSTLITGWNLIPNPYPSNIDVSTLLTDATNFDLAYKAIHVWDATNQRYIALTADIPSVIEWNNSQANAQDETNNIAPFQAFWVKAAATPSDAATADEDITLVNAHRTVEDNANFFKTTPPLIRLKLATLNEKYSDQSVIAFSDESTDGIDNNDALKLNSLNENTPNLSSVAEGTNLSINRLRNPAPYHSVPLHIETVKNGTEATIDMRDENIDPAWTIYLEDVKYGKMHNLRNGEYTFAHDASMKTNRFVVHINKFAGNIDVNSWNNVNIYTNTDGINVAFANPDESTASITISNLAGQLIYQGQVSTGRLFTFPINDDMAVYAVQVITGSKVTHEKVVR